MKRILFGGVLASLVACSTPRPSEAEAESSPNDEVTAPYARGRGESRFPARVTEYVTEGDCDGFPRLTQVSTPPGLCVGLVDDGGGTVPLRMPRHIAAFGDDLIVTDMVGWGQSVGRLFILIKQGNGKYLRYKLLDAADLPTDKKKWLYMPSTVRKGPDGWVYVGATSTIVRFPNPARDFARIEDFAPGRPERQAYIDRIRRELAAKIEVVLAELPYRRLNESVAPGTDSLHPLKPFIWDEQGHLYLGIGADTDNCAPDPKDRANPLESCYELRDKDWPRATIYRYAKRGESPWKWGPREVWATGLRNSLALAIRPGTNELWEGENSREVRNAQKVDPLGPYDELNLIAKGAHYGWPFCEEGGFLSREWSKGRVDCKKYRRADLYLPPHGAPLGMLFYDGGLLPSFYRGKLLVNLHSVEPFGHRLVTFDVGADGRPSGRPLNLIWDWGSIETVSKRPLGAPIGIAQASDGSVILTEDSNRKILRLSVDRSGPQASDARARPWAQDDEWIFKRR